MITGNTLPARTTAALKTMAPIKRFFDESEWSRRFGDPDICDFTIGNSHDMPLPGFVEALARRLEPENRYWYAYKQNEPSSRSVVADSLRAERGIPFEKEDIFMTTGATAALHVVLQTIIEPFDEVIFISPPWFQYEGMIILAGGTPVRVKADMKTYDLDLEAIEMAITAKTRAVIVNSPHNPTGKIYSQDTLESLASILTDASRRYGREVYIISDESYSRIVFDGREYHSPASFYSGMFMIYTYGKVLLTPGERIGFIALHPDMPEKAALCSAIETMQMLAGWVFPSALLQHALGDLQRISVDIALLQRRRDRMVKALRGMGYDTSNPEGTFYMIVRSPVADDIAFVRILEGYNIFCIPGTFMDLPGYFRISLTANDEMIERALPGFAEALRKVK